MIEDKCCRLCLIHYPSTRLTVLSSQQAQKKRLLFEKDIFWFLLNECSEHCANGTETGYHCLYFLVRNVFRKFLTDAGVNTARNIIHHITASSGRTLTHQFLF